MDMRSRSVKFAGRNIKVEELKIKELEKLVKEVFPESKGNIQKIDLGKFLEQAGFDLLYKKIPMIFPEIKEEDVENAYMSEIEDLVGAFVDVNFTGLKKLVKPMMDMMSQTATPSGFPRK